MADEKDDKHFIDIALEHARTNARGAGGGPFGAVVVHKGKVVGEGSNRVTTTMDPTAHAEVVAIRDAARNLDRFDLQGCTVYTSCEPCPMCLAAAYWARVDRVVYHATQEEAAAAGFDDAFLYGEFAKPMKERTLPCTHIRGNGEDPFKLWMANPHKVPY